MITNILIIVFIGLAALWFSNQGLFSSFLHLVVTLCAGALAFAFWEPLTVNYLLDRMPEHAWAVGLLVPFILAMLLIRVALDKLVPGNVKFHNLVDMIGGGAVGVLNAVLAVGVLVIGLQFVSGFDLGGYKPYAIGVGGSIDRAEKLWVSADDFAGSTFTSLSSGTFLPWSGKTLGAYMPSVAERAGTYQLNSRQGARNSIRPSNVTVTRYFELEAKQVPEAVRPTGANRVVVVGTDLQLAAGEKVAGAADSDGYFTATRPQVGLIATSNDDPTDGRYIFADGYIIGQDFGTLTDPQEFARSRASVSTQAFDWLFHVPAGYTPRFIVIKQMRFAIPDQQELPAGGADKWVAATDWKATVGGGETAGNNGSTNVGNTNGPGAAVEGMTIEVNHDLPRPLSSNWINASAPGASLDDEKDAVIRANGVVRLEGEIGRGLAIDKVAHPENTAIVRLRMTPARAKSVYGKAMEFAAQLAPPILVSSDGAKYSAVGWAKASKAVVELQIDTSRTVRSMSEIDVANLRDDEELYLYFRTGKGIRITSFEIGRAKQEVNLNVPR